GTCGSSGVACKRTGFRERPQSPAYVLGPALRRHRQEHVYHV
ncbi:MAG: hypothetical protein AVDCRST_MAG25-3012, partial [uncultured Rubrobacteraceae bacterium]